jgi:uncharacterized protein YdeI (YjbR/CyaY-like superfamily)
MPPLRQRTGHQRQDLIDSGTALVTGLSGGVASVRLMPPTPEPDAAEVIAFRDGAEFEAWLAANINDSSGVWLKIAKKGSGIASLTDDEAVDIGLCYGWISGQRKSFDEEYYLQKYVPRRPKSRWSQVNVRKVSELTAQGRMRPSGLAEVEAAKADGRWDAAYESQRDATVPGDLAAALAASPLAATAFASLSKTRRYAVILDVVTARTPRTREAHIDKAIAELEARGV